MANRKFESLFFVIALLLLSIVPDAAFAESRVAPIYKLMLYGNLANDAITLSKHNLSKQSADGSVSSIGKATKDFDTALPDALKAAGKNTVLVTAIKDYYSAESAYLSGADPGNTAAQTSASEKEAQLKVALKQAGY